MNNPDPDHADNFGVVTAVFPENNQVRVYFVLYAHLPKDSQIRGNKTVERSWSVPDSAPES